MKINILCQKYLKTILKEWRKRINKREDDKMKKIIALLLIMSVMLSTACSSKNTSSEDVSAEISSNASSVAEESTTDTDISTDMLCEAVLNSVEFPAMSKTEIAEMLEMIMDFSKYGIEEYTVYQQAMSVHLCEIIIIRTNDVNATIGALEERKDVLINQLAFYPEQLESAKNTVVGSKNNICYLITHTDAKTAEKALLQKI